MEEENHNPYAPPKADLHMPPPSTPAGVWRARSRRVPFWSGFAWFGRACALAFQRADVWFLAVLMVAVLSAASCMVLENLPFELLRSCFSFLWIDLLWVGFWPLVGGGVAFLADTQLSHGAHMAGREPSALTIWAGFQSRGARGFALAVMAYGLMFAVPTVAYGFFHGAEIWHNVTHFMLGTSGLPGFALDLGQLLEKDVYHTGFFFRVDPTDSLDWSGRAMIMVWVAAMLMLPAVIATLVGPPLATLADVHPVRAFMRALWACLKNLPALLSAAFAVIALYTAASVAFDIITWAIFPHSVTIDPDFPNRRPAWMYLDFAMMNALFCGFLPCICQLMGFMAARDMFYDEAAAKKP